MAISWEAYNTFILLLFFFTNNRWKKKSKIASNPLFFLIRLRQRTASKSKLDFINKDQN